MNLAVAVSLASLAAAAGPPPASANGWMPVLIASRSARPSPVPLGEDRSGEGRAGRRRILVQGMRAQLDASFVPLASTLARLEQEGQVRHVRKLWITQSLALEVRPAALVALQRAGLEIRQDAAYDLSPRESPAPPGAPGWNLDAIRAPQLWAAGVTGRGAVVAVVDTGVDGTHPDLAPGFRGGKGDWFDAYGQLGSPVDLVGHGTQVAGLAVGGASSGTPIGVAPGARWIAARVFDAAGKASLSALHAGLQWALDPDGDPATDDAPDVVNASWTLGNAGACSGEFRADLAALRAAGIIPVFAAGGYGPGSATSVSPANDPEALSVGASDSGDFADPLGSRGPSACGGGPYPTVTAPGTGVRTADVSLPGAASYATVSGSSMAAPHVSGALALLLEAFRGARPLDLEAALVHGSTDLGVTGPDGEFGFGRLDVLRAYEILSADSDQDGSPVALDCDDRRRSVHPGALEVPHDGVDQDCDGTDLRIAPPALMRPPAPHRRLAHLPAVR